MNTIRFIIFLGLYFLVTQLNAQVTQPARFEMEEKQGGISPLIISMRENGLAIIQDKDKLKDRKNLWQLVLLDTALQETYKKELSIEPRLKLVGYDFINTDIYILFRDGDTSFNNFVLIKINIETHLETSYKIKQQIEFKLSHFSMLNDVAIFGGNIATEPAVILYRLANDNLKILPGFFLTNSELLDLRVNNNNTFNVLMVDRGTKESKKLVLRTYDAEGTQLLEDIVDIPQEKTIITAITSALQRDELMVLGAWGVETSKQASGIFSLPVDPFAKQAIQFYEYAEMKHAFDFMRPKRAEKLKSKAAENQKNDRKPNFKNPLHIIRIEETKDGFILLAEMYSAFSSSTTNWNSNNSNPSSFGYSPYFGLNPYASRYSNAPFYSNNNRQYGEQIFQTLAVAFDHRGNLIKDYSLPLENIRITTLEQVSDFITIPSGLAQVYKKESDLILNIHEANNLVTQDTVKIQLKNAQDKIKYESNDDGGIRSWYKNTLYTWGYCSIKDAEKKVDPSRNVFYINKIRVQ